MQALAEQKTKNKVTFLGRPSQNSTKTVNSGVETRLTYFGARYLDSKTSRWISADPAMGDYIPGAPVNDDVRRNNQNLPGMGGIYNTVNLHVYHYAGNNPVCYVDPTGEDIKGMIRGAVKIVTAVAEIKGGIALVAGAAAGEIFSVGLSTPASIALGAVGVGMIIDGISRVALAAGDFMLESLDTAGVDVMDGDLLPSSIGGMIGAVLDKGKGTAFSDTGKVGTAQKTGEKINSAFTFVGNTTNYANTVLSSPSAGEAIINEVFHQYDVFDATKTLCD